MADFGCLHSRARERLTDFIDFHKVGICAPACREADGVVAAKGKAAVVGICAPACREAMRCTVTTGDVSLNLHARAIRLHKTDRVAFLAIDAPQSS